ncbi:MAG: hypothetical protein ACE5HY_00435 [Candidatus Hydrothermarchaeales archaeon]
MIGVVTGVSRFYFEVVKELKKRNQNFLSLKVGQTIPGYVDVVITTNDERDEIDFEEIVSGDDIPLVVDRAIQLLKGTKNTFKRLVVGIDPGVKPGLVVLGDKTIVFIQHLTSPEDVADVLEDVLKRYTAEGVVVKVGSGGGAYSSRILKILQENFDVPIEVVNEISTTPSVGKANRKPLIKDIVAAINIALKDGHLLKREVEVLPKKGEIKNIQRESRTLSRDITISKELAERVLTGEITLEEAIKKQRKKS